MAVLSDGIVGTITAHAPARIMVLGGAPLDGPRTSGGTSYRATRIASKRRRPTGLQDAFQPFRTMTTQCRCQGKYVTRALE